VDRQRYPAVDFPEFRLVMPLLFVPIPPSKVQSRLDLETTVRAEMATHIQPHPYESGVPEQLAAWDGKLEPPFSAPEIQKG
jgi:hypothetical protein